MTNK
jgi:ethanolamine-phosphate cytidylyltransferase